jgi:hypothetical protein
MGHSDRSRLAETESAFLISVQSRRDRLNLAEDAILGAHNSSEQSRSDG